MTEAVHTLQEAAEILRIPYRTLRDAVFQGRWPHVKVSQRKRLMTASHLAEVLTLLQESPRVAEPISLADERATRRNVMALMGAA